MNLLRLKVTLLICVFTQSISHAATYLSAGSGNWNTIAVWDPNGNPQVGTTDSVIIQAGHTITQNRTSVGLTNAAGAGTADFGVGNGNTITIDGGTLIKIQDSWVRIGNKSVGTLDIKDGAAYLGGSEIQLGLEGVGAQGIIRIGDGTGAAGSAILNMRLKQDGSDNGFVTGMNLGLIAGTSGQIYIESDGVLETDTGGLIRVGRYGGAVDQPKSAVYVKGGGKFNLNGGIEIGANAGADAIVSLDGAGSVMTQSSGEFTLGYTGTGNLIIENYAEYVRLNATAAQTLYVGRSGAGNGTITIRSNGKFIRSTGGNVGDLIIGSDGTGTVTVESGGEFVNNSTNWDWIGRYGTSKGYVYVNAGGLYKTTANSSVAVGTRTGAVGLLEVNGGTFEMSAGALLLGFEGNGTFRQTSGTTSIFKLTMAAASGNAVFELMGGTFSANEVYLGGNTGGGTYGGNATVAGTATAVQSGGTFNTAGAFVVGHFANHTATYTMSGGTFNHTSGDVTMGENGIGSLFIGENAEFKSSENSRQFYVGRKDGSSGTLIVNGTLSKDSGTYSIRVGNGDGNANNTTGRGLLGGTGTITSLNGVDIGAYGTLTGATQTTVGQLTIIGNLNLVGTTTNKSTLFINFDSSTALGSDRIDLYGELNVDNAVIDGKWITGNNTGIDSRYWVLMRNGYDLWGFFSNVYSQSSHADASQYTSMGADGFLMIDSQEFAIFYYGNHELNTLTGGTDIVLSAMGTVPEPSYTILSLAGITALLMRRRRKGVIDR